MKSRLLKEYAHKIRTPQEVVEAIGPRPRKKKVVMCHGTFDIVHPGHIRHLLYARGKGDILIAGLTCDQFVKKGEGRPYVPEDLRAVNLAALECVDYVIVDPNAEPLETLAAIQPDFFVKGFEYTPNGVHPKTQKEMAIVQPYAEKFVFAFVARRGEATAGDIG